MIIVTTKAELRAALVPHRSATIGFAPTMGYLHEGHMSLFRAASSDNAVAVASIFVNPTQFGPDEDLDRYPRDPEGDAAKCRACGIDILWMPPIADVYAPDHATTVAVAGLTDGLCAGSRPTHFDGVSTIVAKLFNLVQPTRAYFGQKDYQQLAVIRRMVRDLDFPIEIVGMPIFREPDGLAMSSRNALLFADERDAALGLSRALDAIEARVSAGERDIDTLVAALRSQLGATPGVRMDYAEIVDAETLESLGGQALGPAPVVAALAAFIGRTRLIDNRILSSEPEALA